MLARGRGRGSGRRGGRGRGRGGRDTTESTPTSPPPPGPSPTRTPPPLATTAINEALGLRAEYEDPPAVAEGESEADHLQNLRDSVARAKEAITSARLSADRFGLQHKPKSDELELVKLQLLARLVTALEGIYDIMRLQVGLPPLDGDVVGLGAVTPGSETGE